MLPQGKSLNEIETFCQAFMTELSKHIGAPWGPLCPPLLCMAHAWQPQRLSHSIVSAYSGLSNWLLRICSIWGRKAWNGKLMTSACKRCITADVLEICVSCRARH